MNYSKVADFYKHQDSEAIVESDDPHAIVVLMYDELLKSMRVFVNQLKSKTPDKSRQNESFSKSLTIIYALQSSLNFETGGEIAENLFRLYEFARLQILESSRLSVYENTEKAIDALEEIRDAWRQIGGQA